MRELRKSRSLATCANCAWRYKWNSTCRLQTSKNIIFSISVFDYSGVEVFAGFADLKGKKKRTPLNLRATLPTPADWFPISCLSCLLFSLSLIRWTVVFDFMLVLFSPAFFTKVVGACPAFLWNVQGKKKGRKQKCKRNVHYSIIGLGHSCKACVRLITWGDFRQVYRGVASFSTSCRPGWLSLPHILKIARMISTHWLQWHFELFSFLAHPSNA